MAKLPRDKIHKSQFLIAGCIDQRVAAIWISPEGEVNDWGSAGIPWAFVGPFTTTAFIAWQAVKAYQPDLTLTDPATMRQFVNLLCGRIPGLEGPPDVWTITPEGCEPFGDSQ